MNSGEKRSGFSGDYQALLILLTRTEKYLEGLNIDPSLLGSYRRLLRYLRAQPAEQISQIIGEARGTAGKTGKKQEPELSAEEIRAMKHENILELASNEGTPRKQLESIAMLRFGVTKGGLSTLRNRDALVEKLRTLIGNEKTHASITRAATRQGNED
jgi:hypothetical protein